jgi:hypothetical protein
MKLRAGILVLAAAIMASPAFAQTQPQTPPPATPPAAPAPQAPAPAPFPEGAKVAFVDFQRVASESELGKSAAGRIIDFPSAGPLPFTDKDTLPLKIFAPDAGVRVVPGGSSVRDGVYVGRNVIFMPPMYVNIGAWIGDVSLVDSHALVGSCAQIGSRVHLSAAAQIGGVIEPVGALPVIVEDDDTTSGNETDNETTDTNTTGDSGNETSDGGEPGLDVEGNATANVTGAKAAKDEGLLPGFGAAVPAIAALVALGLIALRRKRRT